MIAARAIIRTVGGVGRLLFGRDVSIDKIIVRSASYSGNRSIFQ
jgi:hypothetical protein